MCGRYSLTSQLDRLLPRLRGAMPEGLLEHYAPRPLIRPGEPVLLQRREHARNRVDLALWGLLPAWAKDGSTHGRPINARAETLAEKASFRGAWRHHRCLIPADGFFEKGHRIRRRDGAPFWLAGLWERWIGADGTELETCCVITTAPNALIAPLHDRMPVVIPEGLEQPWLEAGEGAELRALEPMLKPWDPTGWLAEPLPRPLPRPQARLDQCQLELPW
jgi:putative SOS response-associated peptidase YedK